MNRQSARFSLHVYRHEFRGEPVSPGFWTVEFSIDDEPLSDRLKVNQTQLVCVLGWGVENDRSVALGLLLEGASPLRTGRFPLYVCKNAEMWDAGHGLSQSEPTGTRLYGSSSVGRITRRRTNQGVGSTCWLRRLRR